MRNYLKKKIHYRRPGYLCLTLFMSLTRSPVGHHSPWLHNGNGHILVRGYLLCCGLYSSSEGPSQNDVLDFRCISESVLLHL